MNRFSDHKHDDEVWQQTSHPDHQHQSDNVASEPSYPQDKKPGHARTSQISREKEPGHKQEVLVLQPVSSVHEDSLQIQSQSGTPAQVRTLSEVMGDTRTEEQSRQAVSKTSDAAPAVAPVADKTAARRQGPDTVLHHVSDAVFAPSPTSVSDHNPAAAAARQQYQQVQSQPYRQVRPQYQQPQCQSRPQQLQPQSYSPAQSQPHVQRPAQPWFYPGTTQAQHSGQQPAPTRQPYPDSREQYQPLPPQYRTQFASRPVPQQYQPQRHPHAWPQQAVPPQTMAHYAVPQRTVQQTPDRAMSQQAYYAQGQLRTVRTVGSAPEYAPQYGPQRFQPQQRMARNLEQWPEQSTMPGQQSYLPNSQQYYAPGSVRNQEASPDTWEQVPSARPAVAAADISSMPGSGCSEYPERFNAAPQRAPVPGAMAGGAQEQSAINPDDYTCMAPEQFYLPPAEEFVPATARVRPGFVVTAPTTAVESHQRPGWAESLSRPEDDPSDPFAAGRGMDHYIPLSEQIAAYQRRQQERQIQAARPARAQTSVPVSASGLEAVAPVSQQRAEARFQFSQQQLKFPSHPQQAAPAVPGVMGTKPSWGQSADMAAPMGQRPGYHGQRQWADYQQPVSAMQQIHGAASVPDMAGSQAVAAPVQQTGHNEMARAADHMMTAWPQTGRYEEGYNDNLVPPSASNPWAQSAHAADAFIARTRTDAAKSADMADSTNFAGNRSGKGTGDKTEYPYQIPEQVMAQLQQIITHKTPAGAKEQKYSGAAQSARGFARMAQSQQNVVPAAKAETHHQMPPQVMAQLQPLVAHAHNNLASKAMDENAAPSASVHNEPAAPSVTADKASKITAVPAAPSAQTASAAPDAAQSAHTGQTQANQATQDAPHASVAAGSMTAPGAGNQPHKVNVIWNWYQTSDSSGSGTKPAAPASRQHPQVPHGSSMQQHVMAPSQPHWGSFPAEKGAAPVAVKSTVSAVGNSTEHKTRAAVVKVPGTTSFKSSASSLPGRRAEPAVASAASAACPAGLPVAAARTGEISEKTKRRQFATIEIMKQLGLVVTEQVYKRYCQQMRQQKLRPYSRNFLIKLNICNVFGAQGILAQKLPGFVHREGQLRFAAQVAESMKTGRILMVEAGTGTGKTFSYLVPPVLAGRRVMISTGSRALQDQLISKDIPNLLNFLKQNDLKSIAVKGQSNYICRYLLDGRGMGALSHEDYQRINNYVEQCCDEIDQQQDDATFGEIIFPLKSAVRPLISCDSGLCREMSGSCPYARKKREYFRELDQSTGGTGKYLPGSAAAGNASAGGADMDTVKSSVTTVSATAHQDYDASWMPPVDGEHCFVFAARQRAKQSEIVAVNHALFFAALNRSSETDWTGVNSVLPPPDVLIFDEAHTLAEAGRSFYTQDLPYAVMLDFPDKVHEACKGTSLNSQSGDLGKALIRYALLLKALTLGVLVLPPDKYDLLSFRYLHSGTKSPFQLLTHLLVHPQERGLLGRNSALLAEIEKAEQALGITSHYNSLFANLSNSDKFGSTGGKKSRKSAAAAGAAAAAPAAAAEAAATADSPLVFEGTLLSANETRKYQTYVSEYYRLEQGKLDYAFGSSHGWGSSAAGSGNAGTGGSGSSAASGRGTRGRNSRSGSSRNTGSADEDLMRNMNGMPAIEPVFEALISDMQQSIRDIYEQLEPLSEDLKDGGMVMEWCQEKIAFLKLLLNSDRNEEGNLSWDNAAWIEVSARGPAPDSADAAASAQAAGGAAEASFDNKYNLVVAPVEIGHLLGEQLRQLRDAGTTIVFASATITVNRSFDKLCHDVGLSPDEVTTEIVDSPFDYEHHACLLTSDQFPDTRQFNRIGSCIEMLDEVISEVDGGIFFLTTSYSQMKNAAFELKRRYRHMRNILVQGDDKPSALMKEFREDGNAILVGTSSFWEGVDVPGKALSLVIIDKLPFKTIGDPLQKARKNRCESVPGHSYFSDISLPEAIIMLRQGVGRLIRNESDTGALVILDPRLEQANYSSAFFNSLPPMKHVHTVAELHQFMRSLKRRSS